MLSPAFALSDDLAAGLRGPHHDLSVWPRAEQPNVYGALLFLLSLLNICFSNHLPEFTVKPNEITTSLGMTVTDILTKYDSICMVWDLKFRPPGTQKTHKFPTVFNIFHLQ